MCIRDRWKTFTDCFNCLPIAAIIDEKIFTMHGGLSPDLNSMEQIRRVMRPTDVSNSRLGTREMRRISHMLTINRFLTVDSFAICYGLIQTRTSLAGVRMIVVSLSLSGRTLFRASCKSTTWILSAEHIKLSKTATNSSQNDN